MMTPSEFYRAVADFCVKYDVKPINAAPPFLPGYGPGEIQLHWTDYDRIVGDVPSEEAQAQHYPMTTTLHRQIVIDGIRLVEKDGGKSGAYRRAGG